MTTLEDKMEKSKRLDNKIEATVNIIRFVVVCVLIGFLVLMCSLYGLRDGLIGGFILFMIYGGFEILFFTGKGKD